MELQPTLPAGAMLVRMLLRFPTRSRLALPLGLRAPLAHSLRTYATPGRPKSVVGEPSRPVKRAVKKVAAKPRDGTSPAEKKVAAKKKAAAAKPVKKPKKKVLTPEQKQAQLLKKKTQADKQKALRLKTKDKSKLTDLKAAALDPPKQKAYPNTWSVFLAEEMKKVPAGEPIKLASFATETAASWKNLAPAELEVSSPYSFDLDSSMFTDCISALQSPLPYQQRGPTGQLHALGRVAICRADSLG